jgi:hypothetical protein
MPSNQVQAEENSDQAIHYRNGCHRGVRGSLPKNISMKRIGGLAR